MSVDADLVSRALDLPQSQRAELARRLLLSLEEPDWDPDADDLWAKEIRARIDRLDRGASAPTDWRQAVDRIRNSLRNGTGR